MPNERTVRAANFTCFHAGRMEGWAQVRLGPPDVPLPTQGKLFLRNLLGSVGLEMSLNVVPPGNAITVVKAGSTVGYVECDVKD